MQHQRPFTACGTNAERDGQFARRNVACGGGDGGAAQVGINLTPLLQQHLCVVGVAGIHHDDLEFSLKLLLHEHGNECAQFSGLVAGGHHHTQLQVLVVMPQHVVALIGGLRLALGLLLLLAVQQIGRFVKITPAPPCQQQCERGDYQHNIGHSVQFCFLAPSSAASASSRRRHSPHTMAVATATFRLSLVAQPAG